MSATRRWRGLAALVVDAVVHGSRAIERVQKDNVARWLALPEQLPEVGPAVKVAHAVHDVSVSGVHGIVRLVARGAGGVARVGFDVAEAVRPDDEPRIR